MGQVSAQKRYVKMRSLELDALGFVVILGVYIFFLRKLVTEIQTSLNTEVFMI